MTEIPMREVRGFNYSGSWGTSGLDLWQHHDSELMAVEIARGKEYFPRWNVARWWLSHESFQRDPQRFLDNFEAGLAIFADHGIQIMPVLFNRWRDPVCDFGGVPLEHIFPEIGIYCAGGFDSLDVPVSPLPQVQETFRAYLEAVVGMHAADQRIFAWDICNEPLSLPAEIGPKHPVFKAELQWLTWCGEVCRVAGATQPLTIGSTGEPGWLTPLQSMAAIVDFISFHPYYIASEHSQAEFEGFLDEVVALSAAADKDLLATETVWGAVEDVERLEQIRYTLGELARREIGFIAHALHHSLVADLHAAEYGPVGWPGRLEFVNADGSLRAGHGAFNEF